VTATNRRPEFCSSRRGRIGRSDCNKPGWTVGGPWVARRGGELVGLRDAIAFNDHVASRPDCEAVMLSIGDGLTFIRRRD